jgi:hypothetical protein
LTYSIVWEPPAIDTASRFLADDPDGLRAVFSAIDALSGDPRLERVSVAAHQRHGHFPRTVRCAIVVTTYNGRRVGRWPTSSSS